MPAFGEALRDTTSDRLGNAQALTVPDERPQQLATQEIVDLLEVHLLGSHPTLTGHQIAAEVGIDMEVARQRWRSLGFTAVGDDVVAFTDADLEAMRLTQRLHELGMINPDDEAALIRTLGRSFARLAEWQIGLLAKISIPDTLDATSSRPRWTRSPR